jgi:DNA-directed RNA polymerase subunit L
VYVLEVKVLRRGDDFIELEIRGEGHTFLNALCQKLYEDPSVVFASYNIPHPLEDRALLIVRVSSKSPVEVLKDATMRLKEDALKFRSAFESAFKKFTSGR